MEKRYGVLRAVAAVYQILALLAIIGALLSLLADTPYPKTLAVVIGVGAAIGLFATGQAIAVFLAIEENTRRQSNLLDELLERLGSSTVSAVPSIVEPPAQP